MSGDVPNTSRIKDNGLGTQAPIYDFSRSYVPRSQSTFQRLLHDRGFYSPHEQPPSQAETSSSSMSRGALFHFRLAFQRSQERQSPLLAEYKTHDMAVQTDYETPRRSDSQTRESEAGGDSGDKHSKELINLQQAIDRTTDGLIPFFRGYVEKTKDILAQLPGVIEHLQEGPIKEIKLELELKLDREQLKILKIDEPSKFAQFMFWKDNYEKQELITHASLPDKIKHLQNKIKQKETPSDTIDFLGPEQKFLHKHIKYLTLQQENLQKQSKELDKELGKEAHKYKSRRKELIKLKNRRELQNDLNKLKEEHLSFLKKHSLSPTIEQHILERVSHNYKTEEIGIGIEQLILDRTTNLAELASENIFDKKIEELQNLQKSAAKHLKSEDYEGSSFFLKSQKHKTDYYLKHLDLVWIQQVQGRGCGLIATLMAAADKNKSYMLPAIDRNEDLLMTAPVMRYTSDTVDIYGYGYNPHHNSNAIDINTYKHSYSYRSHHDLDAIALDRQAALDSNKDSLEKKRQAVEEVIEEFDRLSPPESGLERGTTNGIMYPIVLEGIGHPIEYDYFNNKKVSHNKWDTRNIMLPPYLCEEYFASTGHPLQNITANQLKKAIQNEEREKAENTIIIPLIKK